MARRQDSPTGAVRADEVAAPSRDDRTVAEGRQRTGRFARGDTAARPDREMRTRQREEFGGFKPGAAFFGWIVALGIGVLLTSVLSATGAAIGLTEVNPDDVSRQDAETVGIVGGVVLLVILFVAYYAGGYVAGRLARFDGARQGLGVWLIALAVALVLAVAGAILGAEYNVLDELNVVPRLPAGLGDLTLGGIIVLVAVLAVSLLAATLGGKFGERYHHKVDRAGF